MKTEEVKDMIDAANEISESYAELAQALKGTAREAETARKLWRKGKKPWLIKVGLALIAFPDPTISDILGTAMVAAGVVQEGIKRQTLHVDDVYTTFQKTMKSLRVTKEHVDL
ncbi:MAG: hypothetical protein QHH24_03810 [Candidatus Bathyarchaeota archaeon]|nr:hypothetical protein [Candidatus Bathyarchaeota archaeon]